MFHVEQWRLGPVFSLGPGRFTSEQRDKEDEMSDLAGLSAEAIAALLRPYLLPEANVPDGMYQQLAQYLELLRKWNARTNLTAIRDPEEMVRRHFGESLFAAQHLGTEPADCKTLLDFGSGAGFPGLPIQLYRPDLQVTLGESQNKKATFLREVVRTLGLKTEVWSGRVEAMPAARRFDVVALRAVDNMQAAIEVAQTRVSHRMLLLTTSRQVVLELPGFSAAPGIPIPEADGQQLLFLARGK